MPHVPPVHVAVPFTVLHALRLLHVVPQVAGAFRFTSQPLLGSPSQSPVPPAQLSQSPAEQYSVPALHAAASCHVPAPSHCCGRAPLQRRAPGVHVPEQAPPTHARPVQVSTSSVVTRSGPHSLTTCPSQNVSPGALPTQEGTTGSHSPAFPLRVSQFCPEGQLPVVTHLPPLQASCTR